jgi:helicase MOV-10
VNVLFTDIPHPRFYVLPLDTTQSEKTNTAFDISVLFKLIRFNIGRYNALVEVKFRDHMTRREFSIVRSLRAIVGDSADHATLAASTPYASPNRGRRAIVNEFVPGERPPAFRKNPYRRRIDQYSIPQDLLDALTTGSKEIEDVVMRVRNQFIPNVFDSDTYGDFMSNLLWIEEQRAA